MRGGEMLTPAEILLDVPADVTAVADSPLERLRHWEERSEFVRRETVEARLDAWSARIQALRVQVHLAGMDAQDSAAAPLARVEAKFDHARERIRELEQLTRDVWTVLAETYESVRAEVAAGEHLIAEHKR
jgi:uncharacterized protein YPO0396